MYGYFSERKLPRSHQQDSHHRNRVFRGIRRQFGDKALLVMGFTLISFPPQFITVRLSTIWDYSPRSTFISPSRRKGQKGAKSGTV